MKLLELKLLLGFILKNPNHILIIGVTEITFFKDTFFVNI